MNKIERALAMLGLAIIMSSIIVIVNYARAQEVIPMPPGVGPTPIFPAPNVEMPKLPSLDKILGKEKIIPTLPQTDPQPAFPLEPYGGDAPATHLNGAVDPDPMQPQVQKTQVQPVTESPKPTALDSIVTNSPSQTPSATGAQALEQQYKQALQPQATPDPSQTDETSKPTIIYKEIPKYIYVPVERVKIVKEVITEPNPEPVKPATAVAPQPAAETPPPNDDDNKKPAADDTTPQPKNEVPSGKPTAPTGGSGLNVGDALGMAGIIGLVWDIVYAGLAIIAGCAAVLIRRYIKRRTMKALPFKGELQK